MSNESNLRERSLVDADYTALARFRRSIRAFLSFSEAAARECGLTPQQHQAILAIRGFAAKEGVSVGELADHLMIQHNSAVELVNRLQQAGLVVRVATDEDRRKVNVQLTPSAHVVLEQLSSAHLRELQRSGPELADILGGIAPLN